MFSHIMIGSNDIARSKKFYDASLPQWARPNHVGAALSRHKRAGRIEGRDGKLYAIQSTRTEQQAAL
jgi:hypothetical protein